MILQIDKDTFNYIRMRIAINDNILLIEVSKNLRSINYDDIDGFEFNGTFKFLFTEKQYSEHIEHNEYFAQLRIPLNKITWEYINTERIICNLDVINNIPDIFYQEFKNNNIKKTISNIKYKNKELSVNDYKFVPEWLEPVKEYQLEVETDGITIPTVDLNNYDFTEYGTIIIFSKYKFEIINIPNDFEISNSYGDNISFYLENNLNSKDKFTIRLNGYITPNKNIIKLIRKV